MTSETAHENEQPEKRIHAEPVIFNSLEGFKAAVTRTSGSDLDLDSVVSLNSDFLQPSEQYLLLNVKLYKQELVEEFGNLMIFLTDKVAYAYHSEPFSLADIENFHDILIKPFGEATVVTYVVFDKVLDSFSRRLDSMLNIFRKVEAKFEHEEYLRLASEYERFSERLDEFRSLLIRLQERRYKQVETQYIAFDYSVLLATAGSLQGRCRRRLATLQALRQEYEMRATEELNQRIIKLNDVVKKLTAVTVILMLPTLIASHFGMNFYYMPELKLWWAYPAVILAQVVLMGVGVLVFRKIGWL